MAEGEPSVEAILARPECAWIGRELEQKAVGHAVARVVPEHLAEVREPRMALIAKTEAAVKDRLTKEITYWDHRAEQLKLQEQAGKVNARLNSGEARKRADLLQGRLQKRLEELKLEGQISPLPPVALGGLLVVPAGLLAAMRVIKARSRLTGDTQAVPRGLCERHGGRTESRLRADGRERKSSATTSKAASPVPASSVHRGKGRATGAATSTVTRNELLYSLNKPRFHFAIVEFWDGDTHRVHYLRSHSPGAGFRGNQREIRFASCGARRGAR